MFSSKNLLTIFEISFLVQLSFFFFAVTFKTDKVTDLSYGLTFIILGWFYFLMNNSPNVSQYLVISLVTIWGLRLVIYLFIRILKIKKDKRFDGVRENFWLFARFWFFQGLAVAIIMLPSIVVLSSTKTLNSYRLTIFGFLVWLVGILIETIADQQKFIFKNNPNNRELWINSGIWKYSRHPNYFGEMLCWWGIFIIAIPFFSGLLWLSAIGPLFITFILLFVSGIPPLEKKYNEKYKNNKKYQEYKKKTSLLIPWFTKI